MNRPRIFWGDSSPALTRIYAQAPRPAGEGQTRLQGTLRGPSCEGTHTLESTAPFVDRGAGANLVAEAVLPDPCFWSPEQPHLYRATIEVRGETQVFHRDQRWIGLRPIGTRGGWIVYQSKTWVPRAVHYRLLEETTLDQWRLADLAIYLDQPSPQLYEPASVHGVWLIAEVSGGEVEFEQAAIEAANWPAVALVVWRATQVDRTTIAETLIRVRHQVPNLLLAERRTVDELLAPTAADVLVAELAVGQQLLPACPDQTVKPVLVLQQTATADSLAAARRACDALQRDLAVGPIVAGYIV